MEERLKILIIDDDEVDRMAVRRALTAAPFDLEFHEAESLRAGAEALHAHPFACALVDYRLPDGDGMALLRQVHEDGLETPLIMLTGRGDEMLAVQALRAGAADYLPKARMSSETLLRSIEGVLHEHRQRAGKDASRKLVRERLRTLTPRESEILDLLLEGRTNKRIAGQLNISCRTVETHRAHIMNKMRARNVAELVQLSLQAQEQ